MTLSKNRRRVVVGLIAGAALILLTWEVYMLSPAARRSAVGPFERLEADGLLAGLLEDRDMDVRTAARDALMRRSPHPVATLTRRLGDGNPSTRATAATALGSFGPPALASLPELRRLLASDPDDRVREAAAVAAGQVAAGDHATTAGLLALFDSESAAERVGAARASPKLAEADQGRAASGLARLLAHADPRVREAAAEALGQLRHHARPAADALVAALNDPDPKAREEVEEAAERLAHAPELDDPGLSRRLLEAVAEARVNRPGPPSAP